MEWSINYMLGSLIHIAQLLKNSLLLIIKPLSFCNDLPMFFLYQRAKRTYLKVIFKNLPNYIDGLKLSH